MLLTDQRELALDASIVLDSDRYQDSHEPYPHLAIRPYPEAYVRHVDLDGGIRLMRRSMRAEDAPMWHALIANSFQESIRFRVRSMFRHSTQDIAVQHCVLDDERRISIVTETEVDGRCEPTGVTQLLLPKRITRRQKLPSWSPTPGRAARPAVSCPTTAWSRPARGEIGGL